MVHGERVEDLRPGAQAIEQAALLFADASGFGSAIEGAEAEVGEGDGAGDHVVLDGAVGPLFFTGEEDWEGVSGGGRGGGRRDAQ